MRLIKQVYGLTIAGSVLRLLPYIRRRYIPVVSPRQAWCLPGIRSWKIRRTAGWSNGRPRWYASATQRRLWAGRMESGSRTPHLCVKVSGSHCAFPQSHQSHLCREWHKLVLLTERWNSLFFYSLLIYQEYYLAHIWLHFLKFHFTTFRECHAWRLKTKRLRKQTNEPLS